MFNRDMFYLKIEEKQRALLKNATKYRSVFKKSSICSNTGYVTMVDTP